MRRWGWLMAMGTLLALVASSMPGAAGLAAPLALAAANGAANPAAPGMLDATSASSVPIAISQPHRRMRSPLLAC